MQIFKEIPSIHDYGRNLQVIILIGMYVEDCLIIGNDKAIDDVIDGNKNLD
jgi:hypothetical protein